MNKTYIEIPDDVCTYLEGLWFQSEGYKQLIRHIVCQENVNTEALNIMIDNYRNLFTEYKLAFNEVCREFVPRSLFETHNIKIDYILGAIVAVERSPNVVVT